MSKVIVIPPHVDLIGVVAERLSGHGKDYSKSLVIFPGRRPAYFLHKILAKKDKSSFFPPRALSIDDAVKFLLTEHLDSNAKRLEPIDAAAILFDVHLRADPKLGDSLYTTLDAFFPLGIKLFSELEEIVLAELPPRKIREALQAVQFPKFHSLWYYYENFYKEVERRGLSTRSTQYRALADAVERTDPDSVPINWALFERVVVAGFYAFTNVERRIMRHLRTLDHASFIFQDGVGLQQQLSHLDVGENEVERPESAPHNEPTIHFYQTPDTHGQISALAANLREQQLFDERTVIVLPSPESLFPVLHGALSVVPEGDYNISLGYPLSRTPVYGFFNSMMELVANSFKEQISPASYVEFMLHPYAKNIRFGSRSEVTRIIVHSIEDYLGEGKMGMFFSLEELERDEALASRIQKALRAAGVDVESGKIQQHLKSIHDNTIRKFLNFSSVKDCVEKTTEVLMYIFQHSTAKRHPYFQPYSERCVEALGRLGSSLLADKSFENQTGYFAFLRRALDDVSVPFTGTPVKGLQVLGLLETRNLHFDTVYFLDATDDVLPGRPQADMLLPQSIRKMLGLKTYHDRDQLEEYYFNLVVQGAKEVHLLYSETEEGQKEKSRFVEKLLWKFEKRQKTHSPDMFVSDVRYRLNLSNPGPSPVKKTKSMVEYLRTKNRFSASQLDRYLKCPLKFYYQHVLGLQEREDVTGDVDVLQIGSLVHTILKELFAPTVGERLSDKHLTEERLREVVESCFEKEYGKELVGPPYFIKQQVVIQLKKFLLDYQLPKLQAGEVVIEDVEFKREVQRNGYTFSGKIDRVEKRDGTTVIIDYKTGSDDKYVKIRPELLDLDNRDSWGKAIGSFQLPMYMMLYAESTGKGVEEIVPLYLFLGRNRLDESIEVGGDSTLAVYKTVEQVIMKLVDEIVDAGVDFMPTRDFDKHCPTCPYNVICGTQWTKEPRE